MDNTTEAIEKTEREKAIERMNSRETIVTDEILKAFNDQDLPEISGNLGHVPSRMK